MSVEERGALRKRLLVERENFAAGAQHAAAQARLAERLDDVLRQLEPDCLGTYVPMRGEFTPSTMAHRPPGLALPYARRQPRDMHYRRWDGQAPTLRDECGIATSDGAAVVPDVVLVPCVGFTASLWRLGYGGGYFDGWLAAHPGVTAVGVAWSLGRIDSSAWTERAGDLPLTLIVTEDGVIA